MSSRVVCCRRAPSFGLLSSSASEIPGWFDWAIGRPPLCFWKGAHFLTANEKPNGHLKWLSKSFCWGGLQFFAVFTVFRPDYRRFQKIDTPFQNIDPFFRMKRLFIFSFEWSPTQIGKNWNVSVSNHNKHETTTPPFSIGRSRNHFDNVCHM